MGFITELKEKSMAGNWFFLLYPVVLFVAFILLKKRRVKFLIPVLLLSLVILNPWFYQTWTDLAGYAYWRILWVIPVIPICAILPCMLAEKTSNQKLKTIIGIASISLYILVGGVLYQNNEGHFEYRKGNLTKLPAETVEVAEALLEMDEHPRIVAVPEISVYIRQYTGEIDTMYGRDLYGHILRADATSKSIQLELESEAGDMNYVADTMLNNGYDYLVIPESTEEKTQSLIENGFEYLRGIGGYQIYQVHGSPSVIKEWNALGQVTKETFVDADGNPINGENGFSSVSYEYDHDGNIYREYHTDIGGIGVLDSQGSAGYERTYNRYGQIVSDKNLGRDGEYALNSKGYAEVRYTYNKKQWIEESFYDVDGRLVLRKDIGYSRRTVERDKDDKVIKETYFGADEKVIPIADGYASYIRDYDSQGNVIDETYYDVDNKKVQRKQGYAEVKRKYDEQNLLILESYYDEYGQPILLSSGYASFTRDYDENGALVSEVYYDEAGNKVLRSGGYAEKRWTYHENGLMASEAYYDTEENLIVLGNGYAKFTREYDESGNVIEEAYYGIHDTLTACARGYAAIRREYDRQGHITREYYYRANGSPYRYPAGYYGIQQDYDTDGRLVSRQYLDANGNITLRIDGYSEVRWIPDANREVTNLHLYNDGTEISLDGINLVQDGLSGWSEWITPEANIVNTTYNIGYANLGDKQEGDTYTCQIEIEFRNVTATEGEKYRFRTQGAVDGAWTIRNVWNGSVVDLTEPPEDGIYTYTSTQVVNETMKDASTFRIDFRCDYWARGSYRVRNIIVQRGVEITADASGI